MDRIVVSAETGEILNTLTADDRIVRKVSDDYIKAKKNEFKNRRFIKVDILEGMLVSRELTPNERSLLFVLQYYVSYESGLIQFSNGKSIGFNEIVELSLMSKSTVRRALSTLLEKDILYKGKNSKKVQYYMNPWIASKGVIINPTLREMFQNYIIRSEGNIRWKDLKD